MAEPVRKLILARSSLKNRIMKHLGRGLGFLLISKVLFFSCTEQKVAERPNILFIFADDLGYATVNNVAVVAIAPA